MGPAAIHYNGQLMDWLTRGAEALVSPQLKNIGFDQDIDYDDVLMGLGVEVKIVMGVKTPEEMAVLLPYVNKIVDGDKTLFDGVVKPGLSMRSKGVPLLLTALDAEDGDVSNSFYLPRATCISPFRLVYKSDDEQIVEATFKGYSEDRIAKRKFQLGDRTAVADATAPEVESSSPTEGETDIDKGAGLVIEFKMDKHIMADTVIKANTLIAKTDDQAVFSDYSVAYAPATKAIRLTTSAALDANTQYAVILGMGIKDLNGNSLEPYVLKFTTGS